MEERISRILTNIRKQKLPLAESIRESLLDESQIREILGEFWTPSEQFEETIERIRSSSIDDPEPPPPLEEQAFGKLSDECQMDIRQLIHGLNVLLENLPLKFKELAKIETELKETEQRIHHYFSTMETFETQIQEMGFPITISGTNLFLENVNQSLFEDLKQKNIPRKFRQYQFVLSEIKIVQSIISIVQSKVRTTGGMPTCKICLVEECSNAFSPCGHLVCNQCLSHLPQDSKCYFCRNRIKGILKLFSI